jgi:HlyD family secretion protein
MKRKAIFAGAIVLALAAAAVWTRSGSALKIDVYRARRGPIEEIVTAVAAGTVKSRHESNIAADVGGVTQEVRVREGDIVRRGDVLARFSDPELLREIDARQAEVLQADEQLRQAQSRRYEMEGRYRAESARAAANLKRAREEHRRAAELFRGGYLSRSEMDQADAELANREQDAAVASLGDVALKGIDREIAAAKARAEAVRASFSSLGERRRKLVVTAPFGGVVTKKTVETGEAKLPGNPLFVLADPRDIRVEAQIDESESARVGPGQPVRLFPEAYKGGEEFRGRVSEVRPTVEASKEVSRANTIDILPLSPPRPLRLGMSVDVEVIVGRKENALLCPSASVMEREGVRFVYVVSGGRTVRRDVTAGVSNWEWTEILSGLSPGEDVVTTLDVKDLRAGSRVEIRNRK